MKTMGTKSLSGVLIILLALLAGCAGVPPTAGDTPATGASPVDWEVELKGARVDAISAASLARTAGLKDSGYGSVSFECKGETTEYKALPFSFLVGIVDGGDAGWPWSFDREAWEAGYDITLTAADGYAVTFSTAEIAPDALWVAHRAAGEEVPLRIVGDAPGNLQIKDLVSVELSLGDSAAAETVELEVAVNGETLTFTREEMEALPYFIEQTGSYTTSAGTTHTHLYGGLKFADFLRSFVDLAPDSTVKVVAEDGYEMSYPAADLMDESEGTWILAFKSDGEYLPLDPGYIRTVKVGPGEPNIEGHSSARMIKRVVVSGESYKEYELLITGKSDNRLDRQTIQAGVSCHSRTVAYFDRKSESVDEYTGIPLWLLLAYGDDPDHLPHHQTDKEILSYKEEAALAGYRVEIVAADGYTISLSSQEINKNDDVIIATMKNGESLPEREWPLVIVWDKDASVVPEGIKPVRNITEIHLIFD